MSPKIPPTPTIGPVLPAPERAADGAVPTVGAARAGAAAWFLPVVLAVAAGLRIPDLGSGLWYDEIDTLVGSVRHPLAWILTTYQSQNQHLLYSVAARLSLLVFGDTNVALRLPALVFGLGSIWAFHRLARRLVTPIEAMIGTTALAVSYHHVWFSQNARGYTGLLFFSILATDAFHRLLTDRPRGWGTTVAYGGWMALAAYVHITAAFVGVAHLLVLLAVTARARNRREVGLRPAIGLALSAGFALLLYAPVLTQLMGTLVGPSPHAARSEWQSPLWLLGETIRGLARGLPGGGFALAAGVVVVTAGLVSFWRRDRVLVGLLVLPAVVTGAVVFGLGHNLWPRFFFFSAGFAVLIVVRGGYALAGLGLGRRAVAVATVVAVAGLVGSALTVPRAWGPKQDFAAAAALVDRERAPGDAVVTVDLTAYPYRAYFGRDWTEVTGLDSLLRVEAGHPRTWLLYTFPIRLAAVQPEIWSRLRTAYDTAGVFPGTVGDGAVVVMVRRSNPTS